MWQNTQAQVAQEVEKEDPRIAREQTKWVLDVCKARRYYATLDIESQKLIPKGKKLQDLEAEATTGFDMRKWVSIARVGIQMRFLDPPYGTRAIFFRLDAERLQLCSEILHHAEFVTGWNIGEIENIEDGFDLALLSRFVTLDIKRSFDMMRHVSRARGGGRFYKLDDVAYTTLGKRKYGKGADAPTLFAEGRHDELDTYLMGDIQIEDELCWFILNNGFVLDPAGRAVFLEFEPYVAKREPVWNRDWKGPASDRQWKQIERYFGRYPSEDTASYFARIRPQLCDAALGNGFPTYGDLYGILKNLRNRSQ